MFLKILRRKYVVLFLNNLKKLKIQLFFINKFIIYFLSINLLVSYLIIINKVCSGCFSTWFGTVFVETLNILYNRRNTISTVQDEFILQIFLCQNSPIYK